MTGEEIPMTMQVGMVGTDGILIASDTQWTQTPRLKMNQLWAGARSRLNARKVIIDRRRGMAIARARSMETAGHVASKILTNLLEEDYLYPIAAIEALGSTVLSAAENNRDDAQCLIALMRPSPQLFLFQFGTINGVWGPICNRMETMAIAGDNLNSAVFWAERYYDKLPIERLIPLAAHLISVAHRLNNAMISGLEIVLCTPLEIRRLSDESLSELKLRADEWDKTIGELLLNYRQKLTYAPDVVG
jgi:hypothetical protein